MSSLAERFAALPEWAQVWVAGPVCERNCYPSQNKRLWYCVDWGRISLNEVRNGGSSCLVVAKHLGAFGSLEAAEIIAAHWAKMEAEGDE